MKTEQKYNDLCRHIWDFYLQNDQEIRNVIEPHASPMLPPPPRDKPVVMLFVGLSPSFNDRTLNFFDADFQTAQSKARQRRYEDYPTYYRPLLKIAESVDTRLGPWYNKAEWLVEFTDLCHLPVNKSKALHDLLKTLPDVRRHCLDNLANEIRLLKPKLVVANGCETSNCIWERWGSNTPFDPSADKPLVHCPELNCTFHLSGFITSGHLDIYNRARLVRELKEHFQQG
ncbi:MAG: hypothetical protein WCL11_21715 [Verrucomicrobiota bacterium]